MAVIPKVLDWTKCEYTQAREKIRFVTYQGAQSMTTTLGEVVPGHEPGPHSHEYEQLVFIMQGECDFYVDGIPYRLTPGCVMAIPPMVEHYILAVGTEPVLNMDVFCPKRPDKPDAESDAKGATVYAKRDYRLESPIAACEEKRAEFLDRIFGTGPMEK